jgi:hypothetical protein
MNLKVINNISDFKNLEDDWNTLFRSKNNYSIFQSFEFNYYSWEAELSKNKRNILCVVLFKNKDILLAILPLYIDSRKRLRFLNDEHADFCDFLINDTCDLGMVFSEIRKQIFYNSVHLINLKEDSFIYNFYKERDIKNAYIKSFEKYSDLVLSEGDFPNNYYRYKSKNKSVFRRVKRKNNDKSYYLLSKEKDNFPIKEVNILKERMIELSLRDPDFLNENRLLLLKKLFNSNKLLVSMIKKDVKIYAISFILRNSNEYLFWISLFDNIKMIHIYNYISFMEDISGNNRVKINFGRGSYDYKVTNFKPDIKQLFAVFIFENKLEKAFFVFIEKIRNMIKTIYKSITR